VEISRKTARLLFIISPTEIVLHDRRTTVPVFATSHVRKNLDIASFARRFTLFIHGIHRFYNNNDFLYFYDLDRRLAISYHGFPPQIRG
jgi:hypothetical protein